MELKAIFELLALGAAILGVPVAIYQLYIGRREAQAGRDLQVALSLSETFREKWDSQWASAMINPKSEESSQIALKSMLNWVDWLGTLIKHHHLVDYGVVLDTLNFPIKDLLELYQEQILNDISMYGRDYWGGVLEVASKTWPEFEKILTKSVNDKKYNEKDE